MNLGCKSLILKNHLVCTEGRMNGVICQFNQPQGFKAAHFQDHTYHLQSLYMEDLGQWLPVRSTEILAELPEGEGMLSLIAQYSISCNGCSSGTYFFPPFLEQVCVYHSPNTLIYHSYQSHMNQYGSCKCLGTGFLVVRRLLLHHLRQAHQRRQGHKKLP